MVGPSSVLCAAFSIWCPSGGGQERRELMYWTYGYGGGYGGGYYGGYGGYYGGYGGYGYGNGGYTPYTNYQYQLHWNNQAQAASQQTLFTSRIATPSAATPAKDFPVYHGYTPVADGAVSYGRQRMDHLSPYQIYGSYYLPSNSYYATISSATAPATVQTEPVAPAPVVVAPAAAPVKQATVTVTTETETEVTTELPVTPTVPAVVPTAPAVAPAVVNGHSNGHSGGPSAAPTYVLSDRKDLGFDPKYLEPSAAAPAANPSAPVSNGDKFGEFQEVKLSVPVTEEVTKQFQPVPAVPKKVDSSDEETKVVFMIAVPLFVLFAVFGFVLVRKRKTNDDARKPAYPRHVAGKPTGANRLITTIVSERKARYMSRRNSKRKSQSSLCNDMSRTSSKRKSGRSSTRKSQSLRKQKPNSLDKRMSQSSLSNRTPRNLSKRKSQSSRPDRMSRRSSRRKSQSLSNHMSQGRSKSKHQSSSKSSKDKSRRLKSSSAERHLKKASSEDRSKRAAKGM